MATAYELLRLGPDDSYSLSVAGEILVTIGSRPEGMALLRSLLATHPAEARTHEILGLVYWRRGDIVTARKFFREALRLNPNLSDLRLLLRFGRSSIASDLPPGWKLSTKVTVMDRRGHRTRYHRDSDGRVFQGP